MQQNWRLSWQEIVQHLITAQASVTQSILLLKALLNVDPGTTLKLKRRQLKEFLLNRFRNCSRKTFIKLAIVNMPQQKVNSLRLKSAQKYVDAARGRYVSFSFVKCKFANQLFKPKSNPELLGTSINGTQPIGIVKASGDTVVSPYH